MPHVSRQNREIVFKIVYYGPGLSGKTTNLMYLHRAISKEDRGDLIVIDTDQERTLFFDFFPLELGTVQGYRLKFNMYTVPGQIHYEASRRLILEGADGVVFVADSHPSKRDENIESFTGLQRNLSEFGIDWRELPMVLQYNKRDLPDPLPVGTLEAKLDLNSMPTLEAVAIRGTGVMETIRLASRRVIQKFRQ